MASPVTAPTFGTLPDILPPNKPKGGLGAALTPSPDAGIMSGGPQTMGGMSGGAGLSDGQGKSFAGGTPSRPKTGPTIIVPEESGRIVSITDMHRERSRRVRWPRLQTNRRNWNAFHMIQDWSSKIDGQSRIFLPDLPMAIHQAAAVIENQLVNFQNWFAIEAPGGLSVFDPDTLRKIVAHSLDRLWKPGDEHETAYSFPSFLADSIILGLIEGEICWKIFGVDSERVAYMLESVSDANNTGDESGGSELLDLQAEYTDESRPPARTYERQSQQITKAFLRTFRLGMDLVPFEDSYPDPSALNLFHIHEVTRHISELRDNPDYDPQVIAGLSNYISALEADRDKAIRSGIPVGKLLGDDPNQVRVREFWGNVVEPSSGKYKYRNCFLTTVNGKLLRPPTPNPNWHQCRPLLRASLLHAPLSPVAKAMVDHARDIAEAENETASLMIDGGIASVWGTRHAPSDLLADPTSISRGIPPSFTAVLKRGAPLNAKFMERVDEGTQTPQYGMDMLQRLGAAREKGMATPSFPNTTSPREAPATEAVLADEASGNLYENLAGRLERNLIVPGLQLVWLTIWQGLDDFSSPELVEILGPERATFLQQLTTEERFYLFANNVKFDVKGLRNLLTRMNDFRKLSTVTQMVTANPMLQQAFVTQYNPARLVEKAIRAVNIDPTELEWRASEDAQRQSLLLTLQTPAGQQKQASPYAQPGMTPAVGESSVEGEMPPTNPFGSQGASPGANV